MSTISKWFIGCGIVFVTIIISVVIGLQFVFKAVKSNPSAYISLLEKDKFVSPKDGVIGETDLKSYLKITEEIRLKIDADFINDDVKFNWESEQNYINLVAKMYEIRNIQAEILKQNQFSVKKYRWITRQLVIIFGGNLVKQMNLLIKATNSDQPEIDSLQEIKNVPQQNLDLFIQYENEIQKAIKLWILGI